MSQETPEWLNTNTLIGFTEKRGHAWHYRAEVQGDQSNHYPGAVPIEDVRRRLFPWEAVEGTVAVVASRADVARVAQALGDITEEHPRLRVLDGIDTKGLEFDGVVVVEPDAITGEAETGWRTLYVVLTRATQRLTTVGTTDRWHQRLP